MAISSGISAVSSASSRNSDLKAFATKLREASAEAEKRIADKRDAVKSSSEEARPSDSAESKEESGSLINIQA